MKKALFISLCFLISSCVTNYYSVNIEEDTPIYRSSRDKSEIISIIPKGNRVYLASGEKKYRKIKWNDYVGWVVNPKYNSGSVNSNNSSNSNTSYSSSSNKTVYVKGYTRKNGTYVSPYTRSAPKRK